MLLHHFFWCSGKEELAAASSTCRTHVDEPVGEFDDIEIVLDDDDRIATVNQFLEYIHQDADVFEMQTGCRFIENIERLARITLREFGSQFYALTFTAREGSGTLS